MKYTLFLLLASGLALTSCKKTASADSSAGSDRTEKQSDGDLEELMKLPDSPRMMELSFYSKHRGVSQNGFEVPPAKVVVKRANKDLFEVFAEYSATAKSDIYSNPHPELVYDKDNKTLRYTITELLIRKGTTNVRYYQCQVRYGPMNWGRNPQLIKWNWEKFKESGDDMQSYKLIDFGRWTTAETLKINSQGTASADPLILIRGTPDYQKAVALYPQLAKTDADRMKELDQMSDEIRQIQNDKGNLDQELREQLKKHFGGQ